MQMIFSATKKFIINFPEIGKKKKSQKSIGHMRPKKY